MKVLCANSYQELGEYINKSLDGEYIFYKDIKGNYVRRHRSEVEVKDDKD